MKRIIVSILLVIVTCFSCEFETKDENGPHSNISGSNSNSSSSGSSSSSSSNSGSSSNNSSSSNSSSDNSTSSSKITAANVASVISNLSSGTYTVKVTGEIDENTMYDIRVALNNTSAKVNLDLGETTGLTSIGNQDFYGYGNLVGIVIPDSVTKIGSEAFYQCYNLSSVTIGSSVFSIGSYAFYLSGLTSATFKDTTTWYYEPGGYFSPGKISVTDKSQAAMYLKDTWSAYPWYKE